MGFDQTIHRRYFNQLAAPPAAVGLRLKTVFLIDSSHGMMTPQEGAPAAYLTALRGIGDFARSNPKQAIDIQAVNHGQHKRAGIAGGEGRGLSLFEEEALAQGIENVTAQGPAHLVIVTDRDPRDPAALCTAARNHIRADALNSVDFLVVSREWNAWTLGGMMAGISSRTTLRHAATAAEVASQLERQAGQGIAALPAPKPR